MGMSTLVMVVMVMVSIGWACSGSSTSAAGMIASSTSGGG